MNPKVIKFYDYYPSYWVILRIYGDTYKILSGFYGDYINGDEWRMSSGITEVIEEDEDHYLIKNESGSVYKCHKKNEGLGTMTTPIFNKLKKEYKDDVNIIKMTEYLDAKKEKI
jgi:hypothetical protein